MPDLSGPSLDTLKSVAASDEQLYAQVFTSMDAAHLVRADVIGPALDRPDPTHGNTRNLWTWARIAFRESAICAAASHPKDQPTRATGCAKGRRGDGPAGTDCSASPLVVPWSLVFIICLVQTAIGGLTERVNILSGILQRRHFGTPGTCEHFSSLARAYVMAHLRERTKQPVESAATSLVGIDPALATVSPLRTQNSSTDNSMACPLRFTDLTWPMRQVLACSSCKSRRK